MSELEIGGLMVKCIASNARTPSLFDGELSLGEGVGKEGDLVVAEVMKNEKSAYNELENRSGRLVRLYKGDLIVVVLGNRESGTSLVGKIDAGGEIIKKGKILHLLCNGGIAGHCLSSPGYMGDHLPLKCIGLVREGETNLNIAKGIEWPNELNSVPIVLVVGVSSDCGKTTATSRIAYFLRDAGLRVAGTKLAGTGRMRDILSIKDAGADPAFDFSDIGMASTYTTEGRFLRGTRALLSKLSEGNPDVIVAETGGDIIWANIPALFKDKEILDKVVVIVIGSNDVMGLKGVLSFLKENEIKKPLFYALPIRNLLGTKMRVENFSKIECFNIGEDEDCSRLASRIKKVLNESQPASEKPAAFKL